MVLLEKTNLWNFCRCLIKGNVDNTEPLPIAPNGKLCLLVIRLQETGHAGGEKGMGLGPAGRKLWIGGASPLQSPRSEGRPHPNTLFVFSLSHSLQRILGNMFFFFNCPPTSSHWCFLFPTYLHSSLRIPEYRTWSAMIFHHL